jgi:hypothetical protein
MVDPFARRLVLMTDALYLFSAEIPIESLS